MDRRDIKQESGFTKDLKNTGKEEYIDYSITEDGKSYRIPYKMVREMTITNLDKAELKDIPHSARLQYRLLLMDSILKAKIEFIRGKATITYNPIGEANSKEKISREQIFEFMRNEGVNVDPGSVAEREVDYINEIYRYQFDPKQIREHAPYSYSREEWKKMKPDYIKKMKAGEALKKEKFSKWQESYIRRFPEIAKEYGINVEEEQKHAKKSILSRIKGKDKKNEKGFWFHGI